jgi:hypothetical protein
VFEEEVSIYERIRREEHDDSSGGGVIFLEQSVSGFNHIMVKLISFCGYLSPHPLRMRYKSLILLACNFFTPLV